MKNKIVPVGNVMRAMEACKALLARSAGMPGMGLCYGASGLGKTTAVAWLATRENGVYVRARATSTPTSLLDTIGRELNLALKQRVDLKVDAIVEKLAQTGRPLFIDEADYVVGKDGENRLANTVRDLHDLATVPVILIGMAGIDRRIALSPQLSGRMAQWVEFAGCTEADAQKLADELLDVRVAPDMVHVLAEKAGGSIRNVTVGLHTIEQFARKRSMDAVAMADWPKGAAFFLGSGLTGRRGEH